MDISFDFHSQFSTPETVLEGTRYMVAMQIAREPLVRHVLRQTFQERAKVNIKPTKKGKKVRPLRCHQVITLLSTIKNIDTLCNYMFLFLANSKFGVVFLWFEHICQLYPVYNPFINMILMHKKWDIHVNTAQALLITCSGNIWWLFYRGICVNIIITMHFYQ